MQPYPSTTTTGAQREGHKNYVFVDEHNRHKRLKVMRACNGCRKRKIKCDAATTNTWPCSACTRLKLVCVPPTIGQDGDFFTSGQDGNDASGYLDLSTAQNHLPNSLSMPSDFIDRNQPSTANFGSFSNSSSIYSPYIPHPHDQSVIYEETPTPQIAVTHSYPPIYSHTADASLMSSNGSAFGEQDVSTAQDLSEALGELKIDESGIAPYIRQQRKGVNEPEAPTQEEVDERLPPLSTGAGSTIRIPPELMPSNEDVAEHFKIFFSDIHPYVPVVHRAHLYHQWRTDRSSISPLLLEALFACAGRMSDDPAQGAQWLALANRHEPSFMDVPRLSTIQALLLLLKARESLPKKGYYYRSWQTVKTIITMAKDLELHEHYALHTEGKGCGLDPVECLVQTRVWQTCLVVEVMIGGPQGRSDYGVDPETVDMRPNLDIPNLDQFEIDCSRRYSYFVRNSHHIRVIAEIYHRIKRQKDWGASPQLVQKNPLFTDWLRNLPHDLQVNYPEDGSSPWLPSHFVGNMHSHCHLGMIMLHRPQLLASKFAAGGEWKTHMSLCYSSAKSLCRLQEAILNRFGLAGLLYMQRGINFTVYAILTCTMLHLVAITSPDPEFHCDARDYFTRHMRILEQCSSTWPLPEIQAQIDSLRMAFSADTSRPFELKPTFPYGSPSEGFQPSPPPFDPHFNTQINQAHLPSPNRLGFGTHPMTPPISAGAEESKPDSPQIQTLSSQSHSLPASSNHPVNVPLTDESTWDPSRIISSWDMAFSMSAVNASTNSPPMTFQGQPQGLSSAMTVQYPMQFNAANKMTSMGPTPSVPSQTSFGPQPVFLTPRDWQQSVASVYDPQGLKRRFSYSTDLTLENSTKRMR